jgi:hypothetical protein
MRESRWESCQFFRSGQCPEQPTIDRAYLIPQLLDQSELEAAQKMCENCELGRDEKRKNLRISRPFRLVVINPESKTSTNACSVNISKCGILVEMESWLDMNKNDLVHLIINENESNMNESGDHRIHIVGSVKRIMKKDSRVAISFIELKDVHKCAND